MYEISTKPSSDDGKRGVGILIINSVSEIELPIF